MYIHNSEYLVTFVVYGLRVLFSNLPLLHPHPDHPLGKLPLWPVCPAARASPAVVLGPGLRTQGITGHVPNLLRHNPGYPLYATKRGIRPSMV